MTEAELVTELVQQVSVVLAGQRPDIQGAVLADLLSMWLAGHWTEDEGETYRLRERMLTMHTEKVLELLPLNAKIMGTE